MDRDQPDLAAGRHTFLDQRLDRFVERLLPGERNALGAVHCRQRRVAGDELSSLLIAGMRSGAIERPVAARWRVRETPAFGKRCVERSPLHLQRDRKRARIPGDVAQHVGVLRPSVPKCGGR